MKLAMRPKNRPIGAAAATTSPSRSRSILLARAKASSGDRPRPISAAVEAHAAVPDLQDPDRVGVQTVIDGAVEEHVAQPAADDDAEGDPQDQVVDLRRRDRRRPARPELRVADQADGVAPAQQDAGDIGQGVPADRERPDLDQDGVEIREGHGSAELQALALGARLFAVDEKPFAFTPPAGHIEAGRGYITFAISEPEMQTQNPFLDEMAKLTTAAMGLAQAAGDEAKAAFRAQADRMAAEIDLIRRDDFDALKAEVAALRAEVEALKAPRRPRRPPRRPRAPEERPEHANAARPQARTG